MSNRPTNPSLKKATSLKGKFIDQVQSFLSIFSEDDVAHLIDANLELEDLAMLVKLAPRLVHWFRERNHDHDAVLRDFQRIDRDLGTLFTDARQKLREKYAQKQAASSAGPGVAPAAPVAPAPVASIPMMPLDEALAIAELSLKDFVANSIGEERVLLGKNLTAIQRSRVVSRASARYERAVDIAASSLEHESDTTDGDGEDDGALDVFEATRASRMRANTAVMGAAEAFAFNGTIADVTPPDAPPPFAFSGTTPEPEQ